MSPKERIVNLVRKEYERAEYAFRQAYAERIGMDAAANVWDDHNTQDGIGGMSQNPYGGPSYITKEHNAKLYAEHMKQAYECAVDTFLKEQNKNEN